MGKNVVLRAFTLGAKSDLARRFPAKIFWRVMQNYMGFNIFQSWTMVFPYLRENPFFLISSFLWFMPCNELSLGVLPTFMRPGILQMHKRSFGSFQISNRTTYEPSTCFIKCKINSKLGNLSPKRSSGKMMRPGILNLNNRSFDHLQISNWTFTDNYMYLVTLEYLLIAIFGWRNIY